MWSAYYIVLCFGYVLVSQPAGCDGVPLQSFYKFGPGNGDAVMEKGFRKQSPRLLIPNGGFPYYSKPNEAKKFSVWVTSDGYLIFDRLPNVFATEYDHFPFVQDSLVAPYLGDGDTSVIGNVYFRLVTGSTDSTLKQISDHVNAVKFKGTDTNFVATLGVIATWDQVGYFNQGSDKNNTFQVAIATDGTRSVAVFHYLKDGLQWFASHPDYFYEGDEFDDTESLIQVGFNRGDGVTHLSLNYSLTPHVLDLDKGSNVGVPGRWIFMINGDPVLEPEQSLVTGAANGNDTDTTEPPEIVCGKSVRRCLRRSECAALLTGIWQNCRAVGRGGVPCSANCMDSVNSLRQNRRGLRVWSCMNHNGIYFRIRRLYQLRCES